MNSNQSAQEPRALPFPVALLPILALVLIMGSAVLLFGADPHVPLLMSTVVSVIIGLIYGHKWKDIQSRIIESVSSVSETVLILMRSLSNTATIRECWILRMDIILLTAKW